MSSGSDYTDTDGLYNDIPSSQPSPTSRSPPHTPRKRRRLDSIDPSRIRKYDLEGKYNDKYRALYNEEVSHITVRAKQNDRNPHYGIQVGSSRWSPGEQAAFFAALEKQGRDDIPAISRAISTKTEAEVRDFLLLLHDATSKHQPNKIVLCDVPAAIEIDEECTEKLEEAGDALAWYQERFEAIIEQQRHGDYWLITPKIANEVERAVNPAAQPRYLPMREQSAPESSGPGMTGACAQCKKRKIKCSRDQPCLACMKSHTECLYPDVRSRTLEEKAEAKADKDSTDLSASKSHNKAEQNQDILDAVPEAELLGIETMLELSRSIFMNRSPDVPSPWLHWSAYTSQLADEPSLYLTAFKDFHSLAVSVTRRLVRAAIAQTLSRLRAQRVRSNRKGLSPFIKRRDVLAAIQVLGLKPNGKDYWKGVPRRCGLQVYVTKQTQKRRIKRTLHWDEVERLMTIASLPPQTSSSGPESPDESSNFRSRAARSGTPLPMQDLSLSTSEEESEVDEGFQETNEDSSDQLRPRQARSQTRDFAGRYASVPAVGVNHEPQQQNIEAFDKEASQQEHLLLWQMLGLEPLNKKDQPADVQSDETADHKSVERLGTAPEDWRESIEYRSEWEEFTTAITPAMIRAERAKHDGISDKSSPHHVQYSSSDESLAREPTTHVSRNKSPVELRMRGTTAYAALQNKDNGDESPETGGFSDADPSISFPSIEIDAFDRASNHSVDEMDWQ